MATDIYRQRVWVDKFITEEPANSLDAERVVRISESIPADVATVLDVGLGGGYIYRELKKNGRLKCYGIDISEELVGRLGDKRVFVGDVGSIPAKSGSFDLVLAADLLEHVEDRYLENSISELARVSRKYILINSPYKGTVGWAVALCNRCGKEFNIYGHTRSVDIRLIRRIFPGSMFEVLISETFGKKRLARPAFLVDLARGLGKVYSNEAALCPFCLNTEFQYPRRNAIEKCLGRLICAIFILRDRLTPSIFKSGSEICILLRKR
jgi:SAM-dependent methyltransferase